MPSVASTATGESSSTAAETQAATAAVAAAMPAAAGAVNEKYVKYAVGVIAKYDTNKDGVLVADEWKAMSKDYSSSDADGDGRLTPVELATGLMQ